jgi:hypothetical protein
VLLVERLRDEVERVPVEALRVRLALLRRVLLVLLRRVPLVLFWVAIGGNPSSASSAVRFYNDITFKELRESVAANRRS